MAGIVKEYVQEVLGGRDLNCETLSRINEFDAEIEQWIEEQDRFWELEGMEVKE
jgi:hypothetical protein